jgi:hypothetical protein
MAGDVVGKVALGIVCCCGFALAALLLLYAASPWIDHKAIAVFGSRPTDTVLFGAAGLICAFVTTRLIQGRHWAWWTAFAVSVLILGLGIFVCYSALHPQSDFARSESGFEIGISIILSSSPMRLVNGETAIRCLPGDRMSDLATIRPLGYQASSYSYFRATMGSTRIARRAGR